MNSSHEQGLSTTASTLQEARQQHAEHLRQSVVQVAAELLQEHGPEAVTVRRVADKMQCSTKIIYNLFNKKEGLAKQLYFEGCRILSEAFQSVALSGKPATDLQLLAQAYWQFSQEHTSFYQVMFGGAFSEFKPDQDSLQGMSTALSQVTTLVIAAEKELPQGSDPLETVRLIWAPLHGVIHLSLSGQLGTPEEAGQLYNRTVAMIKDNLF